MFLHPGSLLSIPFSSFPSKFSFLVALVGLVYVLHCSPKVSGLVVFVLYPRGRLWSRLWIFSCSPTHKLHMCSDPWSLLSSSLLCCWVC